MFVRMVRGALRRGRGGRVLIALTTALGASVATAMLAVMFDVGDKVNQELKAYGANIMVQPREAAVLADRFAETDQLGSGGAGALKEEDVPAIKTVFWAFNIVDFAPFLGADVTVGAADSPRVATAALPAGGAAGTGAGAAAGSPATLVGTWFTKTLDLPTGETASAGVVNLRSWWTVEGAWIDDADVGKAMVSADLAERDSLSVGSTVTVTGPGGERTLDVAGIITSGADGEYQVVAPLATAQAVAGRPGQVDRVEVSALTTPDNDLARKAARNPASLSVSEWETWYCTAYASSIAYQIEEAMPGAVAKPVRQVTESEGTILSTIQLLMLLVTVLALTAAALGIANLVTASVMERAPEIGLLKAVGARDASVVGLVLAELAVTGAIGGLLGFGLGLGFAQVIGQSVFGSSVAVRPLVALLVAAVVALVLAAGSIPAIRALLRLRPADVLHGR